MQRSYRPPGNLPDTFTVCEIGSPNLLSLVHCKHSGPPVPSLAKATTGLPGIPFWVKDTSIGNRMVNARAETVVENQVDPINFHRRFIITQAG